MMILDAIESVEAFNGIDEKVVGDQCR